MTDITYPTLHATHFDYDADGRKIDMTDATGETYWDYTYDGVHLNRQQAPLPGGLSSVAYAYDGDGRRSQMSLAGTGTWVYGYDMGGRLTKLQSPADGTTTYTYDGVGGRGAKDAAGLTQYGLLSVLTKGNGQYELYDYDACSQQTSIGYWWADGTLENSLTYGYTPGGSVQTMNQGYYATTYGYDGANQLTSETSTGGSPPPSLGYTYDHNGNRLTRTSNGAQVQSFTYDGHDKLTSGTAGNEVPGYDKNGNETSNNLSGVHLTYDDEDHLTNFTTPGGVTDTFTYNGLGLRVGKTDSTGSYAYICDGASPGSPVLSDGHAVYTPGISENRGGVVSFYANDRLGNLWTRDPSSGKSQLTYEDFSGFGTPTAGGAAGSPFGYGGGNGCQTDADTGLVLMGHRYYDTRIGRFISQDPAGDGDNWYAYCDNDPVDGTDPTGLFESLGMSWGAIYDEASERGGPGSYWETKDQDGHILDSFFVSNPNMGIGTPGAGMFAGNSAAGDNLGNLIQALAPHAPKKVAKAAGVAANVAAAKASAEAANAALKHYAEKKAAANAFKSMATATARGLTRSLGAEALGALGVAGVGVAAEGITAWSAGWEVGTAISNAPVGPGGQTVTDYWSDQLSNSGLWMQQNTSFGH